MSHESEWTLAWTGVLANTLFPAWLITFQLAALLLYLTYLTARKAVSLHHLEQRAAARRREGQLPPPACENQCSQVSLRLSGLLLHVSSGSDMGKRTGTECRGPGGAVFGR